MKIKINLTVNRAVQILLGYLFLVVMSTGFFLPIFAVFITDFINGATLSTVGFALALYAIAKSCVQIPLAKFLDSNRGESDDYYVLMIGAAAAVLYPFGLLVVSEVWHLYLIEILVGLGDAALMAAYYSLFARHVDKGSEGFEWSLFSVGTQTMSLAIGAAIGGMLGDAFGFKMLFLLSGIVNFAAVITLFFLYPLIDGNRQESLPPIYTLPKGPSPKG